MPQMLANFCLLIQAKVSDALLSRFLYRKATTVA
jgi:hypothetical protein